MRAMVLRRLFPEGAGAEPLEPVDLPVPLARAGEVLVRVAACGVCRTELDEIEGRLPPARLPIVPGHQVVGRVEAQGPGAGRHRLGARVGVAWIHSACGRCAHCTSGRENLCAEFRATGRDVDGGYAEYMTVPEAFAHPLPAALADTHAAPLLCAGAIGYRALRLAALPPGGNLGLVGFGASAHLVLKMLRHGDPEARVFVFSRSGGEREFARQLGAVWAGDIDGGCPEALESIIDTTPAWGPLVAALRHLAPGGRLVVNAIRKEEDEKARWLELDYARDLWLEKEVKSVANVTRRDVGEFLELAAAADLRPEVEEFPLAEANRALEDLKKRRIRGAKVLRVGW